MIDCFIYLLFNNYEFIEIITVKNMVFLFKKRSKNTNEANVASASQPIATTTDKKTKVKKEKSGKAGGGLSKLFSGFKHKDFSATKDARYTLIIGDEGAILTYIVGKEVKTRNFISSFSADNLKEFEAILIKDIKAPLVMIIDSMDQNFIQQTLPPISAMGVKKLINRRLERDLGKDTIKGYVLLERDKEGRKDWNFLMVSLEKSPQLNLWFAFIDKINNRLQGIYLLSIETENIIKHLDSVMANSFSKNKSNNKIEQQTKSVWKFFITHNKVGGFRQVILKDGRIIFTRLSQAVGEETPEIIAGNIEQEMMSTIEYMRRLSFDTEQGLDIYIVASSEINRQLDTAKTSARNVYKFTPYEVAEFFGITGAAQPNDQFGDVILSVAIAINKKHRLMLSLPQVAKVNNIYNLMKYEKVGAGLILLGLLGYGGMQGLDIITQYSQLEDLTQKKETQEKRLRELNEIINKSGVEVKKINDEVSLYKQLLSENILVVPTFTKLRSVIVPAVTIKDISWNLVVPDSSAPPAAGAAATSENTEAIELVLRFPEIASTNEAFNSIARKILKDVRSAFPDYKVTYTKVPEALSKKAEVGKLNFDKSSDITVIEKTNLEATLSITSKPKIATPAVGGVPENGFNPNSMPNSMDALIGMGGGDK